MTQAQPYLQFDAVGKTFPGVRALSEVSFGIKAGTIHALLGENGAVKSTLLKLPSGACRASDGRIRLGGRACDFHGVTDAIRAGVAVIYQELHLVPELSVAENLYPGASAEPTRRH